MGNQRLRAHLNTILSLTGSCVTSFFISVFLSNGRFSIKHILYGAISGGVMMGSVADSIILPWVSFFLGCFSAAVTVFGTHYITPRMNRTIFQDSLGVLFIYGVPGFLSGIVSACIAGTAAEENYGSTEIRYVFPRWDVRSRGDIAGFQLAVIAINIFYPLIIGIFTGALLNTSCFDNIVNIFDDGEFFHSISEKNEEVVIVRNNQKNIELQEFKPVTQTEKDVEREQPKEEVEVSPEQVEVVEKKEIKELKEEAPEIKHIEIQVNAMMD
jgi:hypothetical protein